MRFQKAMGFIQTDQILKLGITEGLALEIGPGPGYLGLEWLKKTEGTKLTGIEISQEMINLAEKNARKYGLVERVKYVEGDAQKMPFENKIFDGIFTNESLHEWSQTKMILDELFRVLKPGGIYFISDLRRDIRPFMKWFIKLVTKPKEEQPSLMSSINASYTIEEIESILAETSLKEHKVKKNIMGFVITGVKSGR